MRSHRLLQLDNNKSVASCQQAWCKLIVKTFYPQAWCELFQQLAASLQTSSCIKSDFHRLDATWWSHYRLDRTWQQTCIKLVKSTAYMKFMLFHAVYSLAQYINCTWNFTFSMGWGKSESTAHLAISSSGNLMNLQKILKRQWRNCMSHSILIQTKTKSITTASKSILKLVTLQSYVTRQCCGEKENIAFQNSSVFSLTFVLCKGEILCIYAFTCIMYYLSSYTARKYGTFQFLFQFHPF